jgi:hypothetical protein
MLIAENYKNVHSGHDHGISWEQSHINSYNKSILHLIPNQAVHSSLLLQNSTSRHRHWAITWLRYTTRIETMFRHVTFINQLMHSIITVIDIKILLYKSLKRHTLKITATCFGSHKIHHQGVITCTWLKLHIMVQMCLLCVWSVLAAYSGPVCVCTLHRAVVLSPTQCTHTHHRSRIWCQTLTMHISTFEPLYVISVKYRLSLPDDGSYAIWNTLE